MSIIANNLLQGDDGYNLTRSLRFRSSASAYLNRTPASAGNRKTWTWSGWIKRGSLGALQNTIFAAGPWTNPNQLTAFAFATDNTLTIASGFYGVSTDYTLNTTAVFRDPSAYYHLILAYDTTQATASNRVKLYVNGVQQTLTGSYPTLNYDTAVNSTLIQKIGMGSGSELFDGYLTEVNFIDGQALTPSSFGETDILTGVWKPKKYSGTYGTNGFYLPFSDNSALTSGSNAGLGKDFSGNGNYWNTNNISITSGSTYDSMTDVPTLTSATASNFCVLNPLNIDPANPTGTITNGNLNISNTTSQALTFGSIGFTTGKYYYEYTITTLPSSATAFVGVSTSPYGASSLRAYRYDTGQYFNGSAWVSYGATWTANDVIGIAIDMTNQTIEFFKNGTSQGQQTSIGISGVTVFPLFYMNSNNAAANVNFGQRPFSYTPPTGFKALNTFNLPDATIKAGNKHFDVNIWTGDGTSGRAIVNSGGFQPDLVWTKYRSAANNHLLSNSVGGVDKYLKSNTTDAEQTLGNTVTSFNSNGFTIGSSGDVNTSSATYVGWQWKAGGSAVSNTAGTITSTVSANPSAGFSVVTYTGSGVDGATIGHGLGVAPKMIITKRRNTIGDWYTYHASLGTGYVLVLQGTNAQITTSNSYKTVSSSTYAVGLNGDMNTNGGTYVAYCFSEVAGYSKFGSYTGNGSADGTFVYTGFRPKFVLFKRTDVGGDWILIDTTRGTYNSNTPFLNPNTSGAENGLTGYWDLLSNGFKVRTTDTNWNNNGSPYIFMAFAESPFKYALGR